MRRFPGRPAVAVLVALVAMSTAGAVGAQVNIEALRPSGEDAGLSGAFSLNVSARRGNSETDRVGTTLRLFHAVPFAPEQAEAAERPVPKDLLSPRRLLFLSGNYDFEESGGDREVNRGFLHVRWTRMLSPRLGWEAFGQVERDEFTRLKRRGLLGGGIRYGVLQRSRLSLFLGGGAMGESERLTATDDFSGPVVEEQDLVRLTSYAAFRWRNAADRVEFSATIYYQPAADDFGDHRILEQARLSASVTERITLDLELNVRHDSEPAVEVDDTDTELVAGLTFKF